MQEVTDRMWDSLSYAQLELYQDESSGDDFIYWAYPVTAHPWERTTRLHTRCSRPVQRVASFPVLLIVFLSQPILFFIILPLRGWPYVYALLRIFAIQLFHCFFLTLYSSEGVFL